MTLTLSNPHWADLTNGHRQWLAQFNPAHGDEWEKLLKNDVEAAICEAAFREFLEKHKVHVTPNQTRSSSGRIPDFYCVKDEQGFYVDATCIKIETAVKKTGINYEPKRELTPFNLRAMTQLVQSECSGKASQFADLDAPGLLAIGTFHSFVAIGHFCKGRADDILTGDIQFVRTVNLSTGQLETPTYERTQLNHAAFLRPDKSQQIGYARSSISGILLCGLGTLPGQCVGLLHQNPVRPFARSLLPQIEFCEVDINHDTKVLTTAWS
jgi:hypothetical protein